MARPLDVGGVMLAILMGVIINYFGGWQYLVLILSFFILAVFVTGYDHSTKREMGIYEHERGWENVLSNGLLPTILAVASSSYGPLPFIAAVAAVTADKFGSELGVLGGEPINLATLKPAKQGTSGAVSIMGFVVSLAGGTMIGFLAIFIFNLNPTQALLTGICGFFGSIIDSLFGIFEEKGFGTKSITNFICSGAWAIFGYVVIK